jgi:hypothetical protein
MKWQILPENEVGGSDVHYLDSDVKANATTEIYLQRKLYVVNCAVSDTIISGKTKKFKTLHAAKKYAEKWFNNHINKQILQLRNILK